MRTTFKSIGIILGFLTCNVYADALPQPIITKNWKQIPFVSSSDPTVISLANFAVSQVNLGSLYKIVYAQQQPMTAGSIYILTLELVDAYSKHNVYQIQVYVPPSNTNWQVIYSTTANNR